MVGTFVGSAWGQQLHQAAGAAKGDVLFSPFFSFLYVMVKPEIKPANSIHPSHQYNMNMVHSVGPIGIVEQEKARSRVYNNYELLE